MLPKDLNEDIVRAYLRPFQGYIVGPALTFELPPDTKPMPAYDSVRESVLALPQKEQVQLYRWMYDALGCRR